MSEIRRAVFPGSFDPITKGHVYIVKQGLLLFDEIVVAMGVNTDKKTLFPAVDRLEWLQRAFKDPEFSGRVRMEQYDGLTVDLCRRVQASFILRGIRSGEDIAYEQDIAQMNKTMVPEIETVFILTATKYAAIRSAIVRDIFRHGGDAGRFLPDGVRLKD